MQENLDTNRDLEFSDNDSISANNLSVNQEVNYPEPSNKNKHLKLWSFLFLGFIIIFLTLTWSWGNIVNPLGYNDPEWLAEQLQNEENAAQTIEDLKNTDTDQDGLTDYQELYQYYTSMFLPDTDSDGFTDSEEVNIGEDPLCPIGESCSLLRLITPNTKLVDVLQNLSLDPNLTVQSAAVSELRKFLLENGLSQEEVDSLSDEDLLAIFRVVDESGILPAEELSQDPSPEEIRTFLLAQPNADEAEINALSDEELLEIANQLIGQ